MPKTETPTYGLAEIARLECLEAPELPYRPPQPKHERRGIGLIGCGGISEQHLLAYQRAGYRVVALCDRHPERIEKRRRPFFPDARSYVDYRDLLADDDVEVVDATPHPIDRLPILQDALRARKHVLSQKPFVLHLDDGERLCELADEHGVMLTVNQNGRWAPHFSYLRHAVGAGLVGTVEAVHLAVHWNHHWIVGTPFEQIHHLVLYDFGIHWFDMAHCLLGPARPRRVFATVTRAAGQTARPPLLAQALIECDQAQASCLFDADTRFGPLNQTIVIGTDGTLLSQGPDLQTQQVTLTTAAGLAQPTLVGSWFPDGFHGAMGELLCALEEKREPIHSARANLESLALCFAAVASADRREPVDVGSVRSLPGS